MCAFPTETRPGCSTSGSVGLTSHRVTGSENAEMTNGLADRKFRRFKTLQYDCASVTASR